MKRTLKFLVTFFVIILLLPFGADARGSRGYGGSHGHGYYRGGLYIAPVWGPGWGAYSYPYPYAYPYYSVPPVIVEQPSVDYYTQPAPQQQEEPVYWYFCRKPEGYYPYVKQCPSGWVKVVPAAPSQNME